MNNSYSLTSESSRWWVPSAAGGVLAGAAVIAILGLSSAGNAVPTEPIRYSTPVTAQPSSPDIPPGWRQCFMWQATWNDALDGPQPICPIDPAKAYEPDKDSAQPPARGPALTKELPVP